MRNIIALCAAVLAFAGPTVARAAIFSPNGIHVFEGTVEVKKNLSVWTTCDLTLTITVTGGVATSSADLSGSAPCSTINFTGSPFVNDGFGSPIMLLTINGVTTDYQSFDACEGDIFALWNGAATPREIEFQDSLSDTPDAFPDNTGATENPCKIKGVVSQTSGGPLVIAP